MHSGSREEELLALPHALEDAIVQVVRVRRASQDSRQVLPEVLLEGELALGVLEEGLADASGGLARC